MPRTAKQIQNRSRRTARTVNSTSTEVSKCCWADENALQTWESWCSGFSWWRMLTWAKRATSLQLSWWRSAWTILRSHIHSREASPRSNAYSTTPATAKIAQMTFMDTAKPIWEEGKSSCFRRLVKCHLTKHVQKYKNSSFSLVMNKINLIPALLRLN